MSLGMISHLALSLRMSLTVDRPSCFPHSFAKCAAISSCVAFWCVFLYSTISFFSANYNCGLLHLAGGGCDIFSVLVMIIKMTKKIVSRIY